MIEAAWISLDDHNNTIFENSSRSAFLPHTNISQRTAEEIGTWGLPNGQQKKQFDSLFKMPRMLSPFALFTAYIVTEIPKYVYLIKI